MTAKDADRLTVRADAQLMERPASRVERKTTFQVHPFVRVEMTTHLMPWMDNQEQMGHQGEHT